METNTKLNVADVIDSSNIRGLQILLFTLCALSLIMAGFAVQVMGYVAPAIIPEFGMSPSQLGQILGAGNFGVLVGALLLAMLGDKYGRRPVLIFSTLFFSVLMLVMPFAGSTGQLLVLRFIGGIGMGSIMPNATALIGEYSPRRLRVTLMMTITVGFTAGAAFGGFVAAALMQDFGWRSVFVFGGAIPLIVGVLMIFWLPESIQFLVLKNRSDEAGKWLKRIDPAAPVGADGEYLMPEENTGGVPVRRLFTEGRARFTLPYWTVNFTNLINLYFLAGLLPTVLSQAGHSTSTAVLVGAILQTGGTIGTFGLAWVISRRGFTTVLIPCFAIACGSIVMIGTPTVLPAVAILTTVVFITGWCIIGAQPGLNAMAATFYPTYMRSTGVGWGLGIGRIGAIVGPVAGGELMGLQWSSSRLFFIFAIPALMSMIVMVFLRLVLKPGEGAAAGNAANKIS